MKRQRARCLMIQGTASSVGKSVLATALCRLLRQEGLRVAPFKAWNMSLEAAVTPEGGEIARAQAVQAEAAGIAPAVDMNPLLCKPSGAGRTHLVALGRPSAPLDTAAQRALVAAALERLREQYDVVVIEGAGSPAEINLRQEDVANSYLAELADAPVVLVGDIDRGGVFAALVGTLALLAPAARARVVGLVINKFRGDPALLAPGLAELAERTGVPVLGLLPYLSDLCIADEDAVALDGRPRPRAGGGLEIAVVRLPHLSNFDDFAALDREPGVAVRYVDRPADLDGVDLVVLPGSKATVADLAWLRGRGLAEALRARTPSGGLLLGICGGCQMLGQRIEDPQGAEAAPGTVAEGLGLLTLRTRFGREKTTRNVQAHADAPSFLHAPGALDAYEIHLGLTEPIGTPPAPFRVGERRDGAVSADGAVVGTLLHGLLGNPAVRAALLQALRARRGLPAPPPPAPVGDPYDRLAAAVRAHLDWPRLLALVSRA